MLSVHKCYNILVMVSYFSVTSNPPKMSLTHTGNPGLGKAIILLSDIFGWNSGRVRAIADFLAMHGYTVILNHIS